MSIKRGSVGFSELAPGQQCRYNGVLARFGEIERDSPILREGQLLQACRITYLEGDKEGTGDLVAAADVTAA
jgi:hypothetical protein